LNELPFYDNSVDLIFSYHTLEHIENYLFTLNEIYRVLTHGGIFLLGVPYLTLTKYNLVNPYHKQHFNEYAFDLFDPEIMKGSAVENNQILLKKVFHNFNYLRPFNRLPKFINVFARKYLLNVVHSIDFGLVVIKSKEPISRPDVKELKNLYSTLL